MSSNLRRVPLPRRDADVERYLDDLFDPVLGESNEETYDSRVLAASIKGGGNKDAQTEVQHDGQAMYMMVPIEGAAQWGAAGGQPVLATSAQPGSIIQSPMGPMRLVPVQMSGNTAHMMYNAPSKAAREFDAERAMREASIIEARQRSESPPSPPRAPTVDSTESPSPRQGRERHGSGLIIQRLTPSTDHARYVPQSNSKAFVTDGSSRTLRKDHEHFSSPRRPAQNGSADQRRFESSDLSDGTWLRLANDVIRIASENSSDEDDPVWKPVNYCEAMPSDTWCKPGSVQELSESPVNDPSGCQPNDIRVLLITNFSITWSPSSCPNVIYRVEGYIWHRPPGGSTVRTKICIETNYTTLLLRDTSPEKYDPAQIVGFYLQLHARIADGLTYDGSINQMRYPCYKFIVRIGTENESVCRFNYTADTAATKRIISTDCYKATETAAVFHDMSAYDKVRLNVTKEVNQALQNLNTSELASEWRDLWGKLLDSNASIRLSSCRDWALLIMKSYEHPNQTNTLETQFGPETPNNAKSFDARTKWSNCTSIAKPSIDQAGCGSCAAMTATSVFTDRYCIVHGTNPVFSPLNAHVCADEAHDSTELPRNSCFGMRLPILIYQYIVDHGVPTEECQPWPFQPNCGSPCSPLEYFVNFAPSCSDMCWNQSNATFYKGDSAYVVSRLTKDSSKDEIAKANADIRREISLRGPVSAAFGVYEDLLHHNASSGVYRHDESSPRLFAHAVRLIGWGETEDNEPFWWAANSWGDNWGEGGLFRILRGENHCGIEHNVDAITVADKSGQS